MHQVVNGHIKYKADGHFYAHFPFWVYRRCVEIDPRIRNCVERRISPL
jgi:hypothetical protein